MQTFPLPLVPLLLLALGTAACSGMAAGPETASVTPVPASRDSAYVRARRARRALQGESFTLDVVDSAGGRLTGTRWPSANAQQGTAPIKCWYRRQSHRHASTPV
jgi:hypothetical protein